MLKLDLLIVATVIPAIMLFACSSSVPIDIEPTPNIEATVEARLVQERSLESTITARVNSTIEAIPTATLTPTLIPTPNVKATVQVLQSTSEKTIQAPSTPVPMSSPVQSVSASMLAIAYDQNEIGAELKYGGKKFVIFGTIIKIEKKHGLAEVNLSGGSATGDVVCKFEPSQWESISSFATGQQVRVQGVIEGVPGVYNIVVLKCTVFKPSITDHVSPTPSTTAAIIPTPIISNLILTPTPMIPVISSSVPSIVHLYQTNEVAANSKYTGKVADITGHAWSVTKKGQYLELELLSAIGGNLICKMSRDDTDIVGTISQGESVKVRGKILGVPGFSNVVVEPCRLISK